MKKRKPRPWRAHLFSNEKKELDVLEQQIASIKQRLLTLRAQRLLIQNRATGRLSRRT